MAFQLRNYQAAAVERARKLIRQGKRRIVLCAPTGCHRRGASIVTADGEKSVEDIAVGELLLGPDGAPREVVRLCRGRGEMWRVCPEDGESFVVNTAHVLTLVYSNFTGEDHFVDVTVAAWLRIHAERPVELSDGMRLFRIDPAGPDVSPTINVVERTRFMLAPTDADDYFGFTLKGGPSGNDGRYVMADGTVTHNSGKTVVGGTLVMNAIDKGRRGLYVAPSRELVTSPFCKLVRAGVPPEAMGIIMAGVGLPKSLDATTPLRADLSNPLDPTDQEIWNQAARRRPDAPFQIATWDTLRGRDKPPGDLVIPDECHSSLAKSRKAILLERYADAVIVGMSATPCRADDVDMRELYEDIVVVASYMQLVAEHFLLAPSVWSTEKLPDVSSVKKTRGDYDADELAKVCNTVELKGDVVDHYLRRGQGRATLGFACNIAHSMDLAEASVRAGIRSEHIDGTMKTDVRDGILRRLSAGELDVVWNCQLLGEGVDLPCVSCVILARPTKSIRVYLQAAGRGSRPCGRCVGCLSAPRRRCEKTFLLLDHAGAALKPSMGGFDIPQADRVWSLEPRPKKRRGAKADDDEPAQSWLCKACRAINSVDAATCHGCGADKPKPKGRTIVNRDGELVEIASLAENDLRAEWFRLTCQWHEDNAARACPRRSSWLVIRWKELYGRPPPSGCRLPTWSDEDARKRSEFEAIEQRGGKRAAWGWGQKKLDEARAEEGATFDPPAGMAMGESA